MTDCAYLGLDLGGTKLMLGEMLADGTLTKQKRYPSGPLTQSQALVLMEQALDEHLAARPDSRLIAAIGIGLVGRIDSQSGTWLQIDHDRSETLPLAEIIERKYALPCFIDNDVRSAAKAEMLFGRGRQSENWVYLNVGTGIAACTISGGQFIRGASFNAGEVGHTSSGIGFHVPCACGREDCVEAVASGGGLDRCARLLAPDYPDTKLSIPPEGTAIPAGDIFALYDIDPLCMLLVENAAGALANLIMNLVRFCDPDTVVLGGGLMAGDFFYQKILEKINAYTIRYVTGGIVRTALEPQHIGLMGACCNAVIGSGRN